MFAAPVMGPSSRRHSITIAVPLAIIDITPAVWLVLCYMILSKSGMGDESLDTYDRYFS